MTDRLISERAVLDAIYTRIEQIGYKHDSSVLSIGQAVRDLPTAQPEQTDCDYCHENFDGYVKPIEKNSHAFIYFGMNGWELNLRAKGWHGSAKIMYCPMCGRRLERG